MFPIKIINLIIEIRNPEKGNTEKLKQILRNSVMEKGGNFYFSIELQTENCIFSIIKNNHIKCGPTILQLNQEKS